MLIMSDLVTPFVLVIYMSVLGKMMMTEGLARPVSNIALPMGTSKFVSLGKLLKLIVELGTSCSVIKMFLGHSQMKKRGAWF